MLKTNGLAMEITYIEERQNRISSRPFDFFIRMPNSPVKLSTSIIADPDSPRIKGELESLHEKNIREREAYLASLMIDPEFAVNIGALNSLNLSRNRASRGRRSSGNAAPTFSSYVHIPVERRKSARLEKKPAVFTVDDLIGESFFKKQKYNDDYSNLEDVVYVPRRTMGITKRKIRYSPRIPVEHVTENMINNIARKVSGKVHSDTGTSCHQCRQKTKDQKTCCRSLNCIGIRGQFCGICLENRYGEDVAVALMDSNWQCPVCRGICNCSFCRTNAGKRPTGILTPHAHQTGHKSVKDFLDSLKGKRNYSHKDALWKKMNNPKYLLGFSKDGNMAHMGGGLQYKIEYFLTSEKIKYFQRLLKEILNALIEQHDESCDLLGYAENVTHLSNDIQIDLYCSLPVEKFEAFLQNKQIALNLLLENIGK